MTPPARRLLPSRNSPAYSIQNDMAIFNKKPLIVAPEGSLVHVFAQATKNSNQYETTSMWSLGYDHTAKDLMQLVEKYLNELADKHGVSFLAKSVTVVKPV